MFKTYQMISKFHLYFRDRCRVLFCDWSITRQFGSIDQSASLGGTRVLRSFQNSGGIGQVHSLRARAPRAREGQRTGVCTVSPVFLQYPIRFQTEQTYLPNSAVCLFICIKSIKVKFTGCSCELKVFKPNKIITGKVRLFSHSLMGRSLTLKISYSNKISIFETPQVLGFMPYVRPLLSKNIATQYGSFKKLNFSSKTPEIAPKISFSAGVKILYWQRCYWTKVDVGHESQYLGGVKNRYLLWVARCYPKGLTWSNQKGSTEFWVQEANTPV